MKIHHTHKTSQVIISLFSKEPSSLWVLFLLHFFIGSLGVVRGGSAKSCRGFWCFVLIAFAESKWRTHSKGMREDSCSSLQQRNPMPCAIFIVNICQHHNLACNSILRFPDPYTESGSRHKTYMSSIVITTLSLGRVQYSIFRFLSYISYRVYSRFLSGLRPCASGGVLSQKRITVLKA